MGRSYSLPLEYMGQQYSLTLEYMGLERQFQQKEIIWNVLIHELKMWVLHISSMLTCNIISQQTNTQPTNDIHVVTSIIVYLFSNFVRNNWTTDLAHYFSTNHFRLCLPHIVSLNPLSLGPADPCSTTGAPRQLTRDNLGPADPCSTTGAPRQLIRD